MKVAVGSKNPVKLDAVREVFEDVFGKVEIVGVNVVSGVADQPMNDEEGVKGSRNRAKLSLEKTLDADYGVGLEGGVYDQDGKMFECAWCAIEKRDGTSGLGGGLRFELPPKIAERIRKGEELGPIMDDLLGRSDVKQQEGAVGVLTRKHVTRTSAYKQIVYLALVKFISEEWYT